VRELACDEIYDLGSVSSTELAITTEADTAEVAYQVLAFTTESTDPIDTAEGVIIVSNPTDEAVVAGESTSATSTEETNEDETAEPTLSPAPEPTTEVTFVLPVSDPNGFVDLRASFVGVGTERGGITPTLEQDSSGVFFFMVRNTGTKTSDSWDFTVALPDDRTYRSERQAPLKPNERATLALTIDTDDDNNHNFVVEVDTDEDRNRANNEFNERVRFTD
jgi:hypothetical protein